MASLQINTGLITLDVYGDGGEFRGKFSFNPKDAAQLRKLLDLQKAVEEKQDEWQAEADRVDADGDVYGGLSFAETVLQFIEDELDKIYGEGTSKLLFGDSKTFSMLDDFIDGIIPYYEKESKKKTSRYTDKYSK